MLKKKKKLLLVQTETGHVSNIGGPREIGVIVDQKNGPMLDRKDYLGPIRCTGDP